MVLTNISIFHESTAHYTLINIVPILAIDVINLAKTSKTRRDI